MKLCRGNTYIIHVHAYKHESNCSLKLRRNRSHYVLRITYLGASIVSWQIKLPPAMPVFLPVYPPIQHPTNEKHRRWPKPLGSSHPHRRPRRSSQLLASDKMHVGSESVNGRLGFCPY